MVAVRKSPSAKKPPTAKKKAAAKKAAVAKKSPPKKTPPKKQAVAKKVAPKKAPPKKAAPKKAPPKKAPPKKAPPKKQAVAKKVAPKKAPPKKTPPKKAPVTKKAAATKKGAAVIARVPATDKTDKAAVKVPPRPTRGPYASDARFLEEQRKLLFEERQVYQAQAEDLRAEAESLALEREPGDVQFDEESGEGGTVAVDRERDLTLSAQALATIEEIDVALRAIDDKMYGACENCGQPIPKARLRALPYARLCVSCKSGGLHRR
jgi:RNA polymerase-binding transcription factor DksA